MLTTTCKPNAKLSAGKRFLFLGREHVISCLDSFGATPHYGFTWKDSQGDFQSGWMPVAMLDAYLAHNPGEQLS